MSLVICNRCGEVRDESEIYERYPIYEEGMLGSFQVGEGEIKHRCSCGGSFDDALKCELCGDTVPCDLIEDGLCPVCAENADNDTEDKEDLMSPRYCKRGNIRRVSYSERENSISIGAYA